MLRQKSQFKMLEMGHKIVTNSPRISRWDVINTEGLIMEGSN